jgi:hypothetical protein
MRSFIILLLLLRKYQIKEDEAGRACDIHRINEKCVHNLIGRPGWKKALGRPAGSW